ncbi:MAG: diguanylate cyclase domain-containing protein [Cyanophyceae cyanobacterium]
MNKPYVICVDDEPTILDSLKIELNKVLRDRCIVETAETAQEALELLDELLKDGEEIALVISDYILPDLRGDELLKQIHLQVPSTLKIMLTGQADLEGVTNAIKYANLYRFIPKPWQSEDLKLTATEAVNSYCQKKQINQQHLQLQIMNQKLAELTRQQSDIISQRTAELEKVNQELLRLATIDPLTEVANRRRFNDYLQREWRRAAREKMVLSLILCDIDYFKLYNDHYGHQQGDDCLRQVARAIRVSVKRPADLAARYGGEEFVVVLPNTEAQGATTVAEEIRSKVQQLKIEHAASQVSQYVSLSLGVASLIPRLELSSETIVSMADQALYEVKERGRNGVVLKTLTLNPQIG